MNNISIFIYIKNNNIFWTNLQLHGSFKKIILKKNEEFGFIN